MRIIKKFLWKWVFIQQKIKTDGSEKRKFETFSSTNQNTKTSSHIKIENNEEIVKTETFLEEDFPLAKSFKVWNDVINKK